MEVFKGRTGADGSVQPRELPVIAWALGTELPKSMERISELPGSGNADGSEEAEELLLCIVFPEEPAGLIFHVSRSEGEHIRWYWGCMAEAGEDILALVCRPRTPAARFWAAWQLWG